MTNEQANAAGHADEGRGRVAVVLGGAQGIGGATSLLLAQRGWRVAIADIDVATAERTAAQCNGLAVPVDLQDVPSISRAADLVEQRAGPIYAMVNSAAIFAPRMPPEELPLETWERIVDIAYRGAYVATVEFARRMAAHGAGAIVTISSMVGQRPNHGHAYYSSKAAVNALTEGMAVEWGRSGVRVNAVSPGYVAVPRMVAQIADGSRYSISPVEMSALGRLVEPGEVAEAIAFLLSDKAAAITAANLNVDAGALAVQPWTIHGGVPRARPRKS
jgi:NAD(P)-dependent dehydrogenase (short-subunit alcohol dehydrogenase family)